MKKNVIYEKISLFIISLIFFLTIDPAFALPIDTLMGYETNYDQFIETEIAGKIVYFYQRMIDDAIVEKDFKVYHFDKKTGEFITKKSHWRDGLPEHLPKLKISKDKAQSMVKGTVKFSELYIISPESDVFPVKPTPNNPCWVVRSIDNNIENVTIIDAIEGKILSYGISPPYTAFSLSGPMVFYPCGGAWDAWYKNARNWFNTMGYNAETVTAPTREKIESHIKSHSTALFYEAAHGDSLFFTGGCINGKEGELTTLFDIEDWINGCQKIPFAFLSSCDAMCDTSYNSLSYKLKKGSNNNTSIVGYCGMGESKCSICWSYSVDWQNSLFNYMNKSYKVKEAFDNAQADYPACAGINNCIRFSGDENFSIVPIIKRDVLCRDTCDASPGCNLIEPEKSWCDGNIKKTCNSNCQYSEKDCKDYGSTYYCSYGICKKSSTGGGCGRWCYLLGLSGDSEFFLIAIVATVLIIVLIFSFFGFFVKNK